MYFAYVSHIFHIRLTYDFTCAAHTLHIRITYVSTNVKIYVSYEFLHMFCMRGHLGYVYVPPRKPWRQIWWGPAQPLPTKWGSTIKNWCQIVILKVQMQAWHESPTAITVGKLNFNVRCKRSRIGVKLRLYPFWNVRHNRFARNKNLCKIAILQGQAQPFHAKWLSNLKNGDFPTPEATLSHDMMAERQKIYVKNAFFLRCVKAALWNRFFCGKASVCKGFCV